MVQQVYFNISPQIAVNADLFSTFAALSEDLVFYVKTIDNEYRSKKQASRKYFQ